MAQTINPDALSYWQGLLSSPSSAVQQNARAMLVQSGYDANGQPIVSPGSPSVPTTVGATPSGYRADTGGVPQVPSLPAVQQQALAANASALPSIEELAASLNAVNQGSLLNQYRTALPGYDAMTAASSGNIQSLLAGDVPADVKRNIINTAAERGIATGLYDSPNSDASLLQALGLTSLGLQEQGESELTAAIGRSPTVSPVDLTRMFVDPTQAYEAQLLANIYASAPNPGAARDSLLSTLGTGYNSGRSNVPVTKGSGTIPSISSPSPGGSGGFSNVVNQPPSQQWQFDPTIGAYYNTLTGAISDSPGGQPWEGFSYGDVYNTRAGSASGWNWNADLGMYINETTGEVSDNPAGGYSTGMLDDYYTPATEE